MDNAVVKAFVDEQSSRAVVKLSHDYCNVATGFFVTRRGHLLTAYHAFKDVLPDETAFNLMVTSYACDPVNGHRGAGGPQTFLATYRPSWGNREEDWVLLKIDVDSPACLPVGPIASVRETDDVLTYGFAAADQPGQGMSALKGQISHLNKPHHHFDLSYLPRGRGHSGGPLYHLDSHTVVGLTLGLHEKEFLSDVGIGVHFDSLFAACPELATEFEEMRREWRRALTTALAENDKSFPELQQVPPLPKQYLLRHDILKQATAHLEERGAVLLHGGPGTGKTTLLSALATQFQTTHAPTDPTSHRVFWHDFGAPGSVDLERFVRNLSLFLAREASEFDPLGRFLEDSPDGRPALGLAAAKLDDIVHLVTNKVRSGGHILCLDNLHVTQRREARHLLGFLETLIRGVTPAAKVILASWDDPDFEILGQLEVHGFDREEVKAYLRLFSAHHVGPELEEACGEMAMNIEVLKLWLREVSVKKMNVAKFLREPPSDLQRYIRKKYVMEWTPEDRSVLLGFSVFGRPVEPGLAEAVAGIGEFPAVFAKLQCSPPLLDAKGENRFEPHSLVRQAVLDVATAEQRKEMQRRAGQELAAREQFLDGASQYIDADRHDLALALFDGHAEAILAQGEVKRMLDKLEVIETAIGSRGHDADSLRRLHLVRADCKEFCGNYEGAVDSYRKSLGWTNRDEQKARVMIRVGNCFRLWSRYDDARETYNAVDKLTARAHSVEDRTIFARALLGRAKLDRLACRYPEALQAYGKALDAFEGLLDRSGLIEARFGFGEVYRLRHEYDLAWPEYAESKRLSVKAGNRHREAFAAWGLGEIHRLRGDYSEAEREHEYGLELMEKVGDRRSEGWAYLGLAEVSRALRQFDRAEAAFRQAIRLCGDTGSMTEVGHATLGLAEVARCRGRTDLGLYDEAETLFRQRGLHHCLVLLLIGKALALAPADTIASRALLGEAAGICDRHQLEPERLRIKDLQGRHLDASRQARESNPLNFP